MKLPFFNKPSPDARTHVVNPTGQAATAKIPPHVAAGSALKRANGGRINSGMWVVYSDDMFPNKPGVLLALGPNDEAAVMLCQEDGKNLLEVRCYASRLRQARYNEIPAPRRPTQEIGNALGYF